MKHPRNRSTAKVETKQLSLAPSKKRDTATVANSDVANDFKRPNQRSRALLSLRPRILKLPRNSRSKKH